MARPREFDAEKAVLDAMNVFWKFGYNGSSVAMLLDGMGLTKGSLYKAFSDKKSLFLTAMTRYEELHVVSAVALLRDGAKGDGKARIAMLFGSIPDAVRMGDNRGCLLCSAAAGPAANDHDIAQAVEGLLGQMRAGFEYALGAEMAPEVRRKMASFLVTQYIGLRIMARARMSVEEMDRSVSALLDLLDSKFA